MARVFKTAAEMAVWQRRRHKAVLAYFQIRHREMVAEIVQEMYRLTSGKITLAELARRGYPFGRGHGRTTYNPRANKSASPGTGKSRVSRRGSAPMLPINRQRGNLQRRLFSKIVLRTLTRQVIDAGFHAGANWVILPNGTRKMVGRGFWVAIAAFAKKAQRRMLDDVWKYEFSYR